MPELDPKSNKTNEIKHAAIPDNTITVILKSGGKVYSKGLTLPIIDKDTADEDVTMAMQRIHDSSEILINTVFYTLKGHDQKDVKPELV